MKKKKKLKQKMDSRTITVLLLLLVCFLIPSSEKKNLSDILSEKKIVSTK